MNALIKSALILDNKSDFHKKTQDILIEDGIITKIANSLKIPIIFRSFNLKTFTFLKVGLIAVYALESQDMKTVKQSKMD